MLKIKIYTDDSRVEWAEFTREEKDGPWLDHDGLQPAENPYMEKALNTLAKAVEADPYFTEYGSPASINEEIPNA